MGHWSELPAELLEVIEENVILYADKVRLRSVCAPWRSTLATLPHQKLCQSPCLLVPYENNSVTSCGLFSPFDDMFYQLELPEPVQGKLFKGSSHGWVVTVGDSPSLSLFNPLTGAQLKLPPSSSFPDVIKYHSHKVDHEYAIRFADDRNDFYTLDARHMRDYFTTKIVLSESPPAGDNYLAVAIYGEFQRLVYCRKGYKKWVYLREDRCTYLDVIFFKGLLYALDGSGSILICEVGSNCPTITKIEIIEHSFIMYGDNKFYLVEYSGALLMVERKFRYVQGTMIRRTCRFKIYKLNDDDAGVPSWIEVKDLGGDALFLGPNMSSSISSGDFPGCKRNCIYFTDDYHEDTFKFSQQEEGGIQGVDFDMGIYDLNEGSIERFSRYKCDGKNLFWPRPIWITPKTC